MIGKGLFILKINVKRELSFAEGMVERRHATVENIGHEKRVGEAVENFRSMLVCLKECEKHHNNVMQEVSDDTAGVGVETSALVDFCRKWVAQCEHNLRTVWGVPGLRVDDIKRGVGLL